jgi:hypothetical protein
MQCFENHVKPPTRPMPALSTGPRTGKSRSSQNARKHGLTATQFVIAAEDREEFDELHAQLQADIRPQGALQQILFDQLVAAAWNLRRIRRMEAELTASTATYLDILDSPELTAKLDCFARRQTRIERSFDRSLRLMSGEGKRACWHRALPRLYPSLGHRRPPKRRRRRILVWSRR